MLLKYILLIIVLENLTIGTCYKYKSKFRYSNKGKNGNYVSESMNLFANDFYKIITNVEEGSFICSPFSLGSVLTMAKAGAKRQTAEALHRALRLPNLEDSNIFSAFSELLLSYEKDKNLTLEIANNVFVDKSYDVLDDYLDLLRKNFDAGTTSLNFANNYQAAETINAWVEDSTRNKIRDLISADYINKDTRLFLVNAIYFKGIWKKSFSVEDTTLLPFYTSETEFIKMEMMRKNGNFLYGKFPEIKSSVVLLPYEGDRMSLIIVLPDKRTGLLEMEKLLNASTLVTIPSRLDVEYLSLSLPKFKIESTFDLIKNKVISKLGMNIISSKQADFSGISKSPGLFVSQIVQKAFLEVNENGSEASVASAAGFDNRVAHISIPFDVDHPFMAYIYDEESKTVIFMLKKVN